MLEEELDLSEEAYLVAVLAGKARKIRRTDDGQIIIIDNQIQFRKATYNEWIEQMRKPSTAALLAERLEQLKR